jgi:hypothetical protein
LALPKNPIYPMNLPDVNTHNVAQQLNNDTLVAETAQQIMKDFGLFGVSISFSGDTSNAYYELHNQLVEQLGALIETDFGRLLSVLYQVDITDKEIAQAQAALPNYTHIEVVAHQVIVRDLKKVLIRNYFKENP